MLVHTRKKAWSATYRGIYSDAFIDDFDYAWHETREYRNLQNPAFHSFLVMEGNSCLGYVTYIEKSTPLWRDYQFRLLSLYLLPEAQGRGIGRLIFGFLQEQCTILGHEKFYFSCDPCNAKALSFYQHMGCRIVAEDLGHERPEEDSIEFEFRI